MPPERSINGLEAPQAFSAREYPAQLSRRADGYAITVTGLPSEQAAMGLIPQVWSALVAVTAQGSACSASFTPARITRTDDPAAAAVNLFGSSGSGPKEVHGIADADGPVAYREGETIVSIHGGNASFSIGTNAEQVVAALRRGFETPRAMDAFRDARLRTAVDLYVASWYEGSPAARLLITATVLEVLSPSAPRHQVVTSFLEQWTPEVTRALAAHQPHSQEALALDSLQRELLFKRDQSIRSRIVAYVLHQLNDAGVASPAEYALKARDAYDARSELTHTGSAHTVDVGTALTDLRQIVPALLLIELGLPHGLPERGISAV